MLSKVLLNIAFKVLLTTAKRAVDSDDDDELLPSPDLPDVDDPITGDPDVDISPVTEEMFSSWALCIMLFLLISALWSGYYLTQKRIRAVHETVLSIFYGMVIGLIIRMSPGHYIQDTVTFNSTYFFNVLLPPIILNSGYELNQANFFNNMVSILIFAIPGTFISAVVIGIILYIWTFLGLESIDISFADALSVGATLSATDPVTILSIFNAYKVDPKLYTIIFGESLLNDAISIVMFETCQKFHGQPATFSSVFEGAGLFLMTFSVSLLIGVLIGILVALLLKHTLIRRYPQIESCLILLIAYESYFFSNGCHMSGIVSLLFCGITLKHYAYYNMSRRSQITIKYIFQLLARLSENFIFIYLGLELFTEVELVYKPLLIIVAAISICVARWCAVFPLSRFINWIYRMKTIRSMSGVTGENISIPDEIPYNYQMMTFWAGLRGAVGVALALGIQGEYKFTLLATVLVVVVLTVIIFGGTTAGMLEVLNIKTGCISEEDVSDDEFDIEAPRTINFMSGSPMPTGLGPYSDNNSPDVSIDQLTVNNNNNNNNKSVPDHPSMGDNSFGELDETENTSPNLGRSSIDKRNLRDKLGTIFNADSQWFQNFDEQVLKPVFLDNMSPSIQDSATQSPSEFTSQNH
ncbi:monovalent cation:H+ antiporter, CPA1 (nhx1) [Saccharomyces pastorianus]|uniref:Sodium/hydrogen exchanger n=1 Tax=Saccharomyces pastorianus TaxID=27292 RepID=A0A6C1E3Q6_SACPS|nr:monovalent cation:H+ antiporter, CPA1 (nhx1) [Saccharomyces pastorianus]